MTEPTHRLDHDRPTRVGMPEAVLCEGKQDAHLRAILDEVIERGAPMLLTRLPLERVQRLGLDGLDGVVHDAESETATVHGVLPPRPGLVAVVAAGTSDLRVATEVLATLRFSGVRAQGHHDVGVAGVHRLMERIDEIRAADVVVVVAGMDAALASVMGGLVAAPVVAVPTSVGYGVAAGGTTALHAMLASCAQGVVVTNIDNGFGAACAAVRMLGVAVGGTVDAYGEALRAGPGEAPWINGWIDASAGVSGDMLLGALVDVGVPVDVLRAAVAPLGLDLSYEVSQVTRGGLRAAKVEVVCPREDQPHRALPDVLALLDGLADPSVRDGAAAVFRRLAEAEASVHGVGRDEVQFHEVGALDAIADVVGVIAAVASLGWTQVHAGPVGVGRGRIGAAHGSLPVPAPAVLALCEGLPVTAGPATFESATPTGMALLAHVVTAWDGLPAMTIAASGVGAGSREADSHPNVLRVASGVVASPPGDGRGGTRQVDANVDDMDPRLWPGAIDAVLAAGAVDAWVTPVTMKKGRPAMTFSALVEGDALDAVQRAMLTHTTTIGLRVHEVDKVALERHVEQVDVAGHPVRVKVATLDGVEVNRSVEWDDVQAAATALGRPAKDILAEATAAASATPPA